MAMNMKISKDINGNKTVVISPEDERGFSIQTNGNLPKTHHDHSPDSSEIACYVRDFGTTRQKALFGYY